MSARTFAAKPASPGTLAFLSGAHYCVLRFDAPARRLLGLPLEIAKLTSGRATQQMIVSGYR